MTNDNSYKIPHGDPTQQASPSSSHASSSFIDLYGTGPGPTSLTAFPVVASVRPKKVDLSFIRKEPAVQMTIMTQYKRCCAAVKVEKNKRRKSGIGELDECEYMFTQSSKNVQQQQLLVKTMKKI